MIGKNSTFIDTNGEEESSLGEGRRYEHRKMMFTDIKEDQTLTHDWESPKDGVYRHQGKQTHAGADGILTSTR